MELRKREVLVYGAIIVVFLLTVQLSNRFATVFSEQILPKGCGYISDLGATAPTEGILGVRTDVIVARYRTKSPHPYRVAEGSVRAEGALFEIDPVNGKCKSVTRVAF